MVSDCRWNIRVGRADDERLQDIIDARSALTHEYVSQTGTIKRAVYELWERECGACREDQS